MLFRYAVMGNPISHSLSPTIHHFFAEQTGRTLVYEKIEIDLSRFEQQVMEFFNQGGKGLNITLPCKERAFKMCATVSDRCATAQSANTLWMKQEGLQGDNTDGVGLLRDLNRHIALAGKRILLLGAGGAARGVVAPLLSAQPLQLTIANRSLDKARALQQVFKPIHYSSFEELGSRDYDVIINATSASLDNEPLALPASLLANAPFCYDLSYSKQGETAFVTWARQLGCIAFDGLGMLVEQAAEAFYIWHGVMPNSNVVLATLKSMQG